MSEKIEVADNTPLLSERQCMWDDIPRSRSGRQEAVVYVAIANWRTRELLVEFTAPYASKPRTIQRMIKDVVLPKLTQGASESQLLKVGAVTIFFSSCSEGFAVIHAATATYSVGHSVDFQKDIYQRFTAGRYLLEATPHIASFPTCEGELLKKGYNIGASIFSAGAWKTRYFELRDHVIHYSAHKGDRVEKGHIALHDVETVEVKDDHYLLLAQSDSASHDPGRVYELYHAAKTEVARWHHSILDSQAANEEAMNVEGKRRPGSFIGTLEKQVRVFTFDPPLTQTELTKQKMHDVQEVLIDNLREVVERHGAIEEGVNHSELLQHSTYHFNEAAVAVKRKAEYRYRFQVVACMVIVLALIIAVVIIAEVK